MRAGRHAFEACSGQTGVLDERHRRLGLAGHRAGRRRPGADQAAAHARGWAARRRLRPLPAATRAPDVIRFVQVSSSHR